MFEHAIADPVKIEELVKRGKGRLKFIIDTNPYFLYSKPRKNGNDNQDVLYVVGELQMEFTFDATKLNGEQVVVFEEVYLEEKLVAVHADLEDEGQSVTYKKEKQVEEEKPESPEKPKETEKAKTVATGDGSYVKILVFLIGVILTGALLLCFLLSRMWGRMWKRR